MASKYLDGYLAWFGFAFKKGAVAMNVKTNDMILEACVKGLGGTTTWDSIRLSRFEIT